jgi:hypothetical protein
MEVTGTVVIFAPEEVGEQLRMQDVGPVAGIRLEFASLEASSDVPSYTWNEAVCGALLVVGSAQLDGTGRILWQDLVPVVRWRLKYLDRPLWLALPSAVADSNACADIFTSDLSISKHDVYPYHDKEQIPTIIKNCSERISIEFNRWNAAFDLVANKIFHTIDCDECKPTLAQVSARSGGSGDFQLQSLSLVSELLRMGRLNFEHKTIEISLRVLCQEFRWMYKVLSEEMRFRRSFKGVKKAAAVLYRERVRRERSNEVIQRALRRATEASFDLCKRTVTYIFRESRVSELRAANPGIWIENWRTFYLGSDQEYIERTAECREIQKEIWITLSRYLKNRLESRDDFGSSIDRFIRFISTWRTGEIPRLQSAGLDLNPAVSDIPPWLQTFCNNLDDYVGDGERISDELRTFATAYFIDTGKRLKGRLKSGLRNNSAYSDVFRDICVSFPHNQPEGYEGLRAWPREWPTHRPH